MAFDKNKLQKLADLAKQRKSGGKYPPKDALEASGHELKVNPPAILGHTAKKFGPKRAEAQRKAILLAKARKAGAAQ